ncbi:hypothetical protein [Hymenobacter psychrophilus]|uniref:Uncharacterized protein n=1 Tax=Hymenobacter psychrophilus TaxID=651662 RepID=A0A1H3IPY6_9BACT|nr:hypothetical protein [Hymenobacter psychrophilus]SDY29770.1 hypothetical protein SAMN04488069_107109 [Hymenobacter psychrophilus]
MTNKSYFFNFFVPLCASLSDDEFLAFAESVLANLKKDSKADAADVAGLEAQVTKLRAAHTQRGISGKSASVATLKQAVRDFLQWAKLTNIQKVFPAFPDRKQAERIDIFPGGMDALYRADQTNLLSRAKYYLDKISGPYGKQTGITAADAAKQYKALEEALTGRTTAATDKRSGSAAVDAEELAVCEGLYRAYAGLLYHHSEHPEQAYAYFPFPNATGTAADANLASLPKGHPADEVA